jgi:hypothetical protein
MARIVFNARPGRRYVGLEFARVRAMAPARPLVRPRPVGEQPREGRAAMHAALARESRARTRSRARLLDPDGALAHAPPNVEGLESPLGIRHNLCDSARRHGEAARSPGGSSRRATAASRASSPGPRSMTAPSRRAERGIRTRIVAPLIPSHPPPTGPKRRSSRYTSAVLVANLLHLPRRAALNSRSKQPCWGANHVPAIRPRGSYALVLARN